MAALMAIPRYWAILLALYGAYEQQWLERRIAAAQRIPVGASEGNVLSILGEPLLRFDKRSDEAAALFGKVPRKWIYGPIVDFQYFFVPDFPFPNPIPIKLRLWSPDEEDLVIDWGDKNTVSKITRPRAKRRVASKK